MKQILFLLKVSIGSSAAIILANHFGLLYSSSAGIITLLTIQNTKKETLRVAIRRFEAFIAAVIIAFALFNVFGYSPLTFGFILFFFVATCLLLGLKDGIPMNAVLMTHFLIERRMDLSLLLNEAGLMLIGIGIGILLNLIMLGDKKRIRMEQSKLEDKIKETLFGISALLKDKNACLIQTADNRMDMDMDYVNSKEIDFTNLDHMLDLLLSRAYEKADNTLLRDTKYLISYLEMRKQQIGVLKNIRNKIKLVPVSLKQSFPLADYIEEIANSFHELNNVIALINSLEDLKKYYKEEPLPVTREEFEYRAVLYQILTEIEYFLFLKRDFVDMLESENLKSYWS